MSLAMASQEKPRVKRNVRAVTRSWTPKADMPETSLGTRSTTTWLGAWYNPWKVADEPTLGLASRPRSSRRSPLFPWSQMSNMHMTDARRAKSMQEEWLGKKTTKEKVHCLDDVRCMRLQEDLSLQRHHGQL